MDLLLTSLVVIGTVVALFVTRPWSDDDSSPRSPLRAASAPEETRSISIDFGIVTDPDTDWDEVSERLASVDATTVEVNAGRVEFTAFDWAAHPEAAAEAGTDHVAVAARGLRESPEGGTRQLNLIVDAFVPKWIQEDPSIAGVGADGKRSRYAASAWQLARGEVGDRLVDYVEALAERYDPPLIEITELLIFDTFGADDLALYREMTGQADWPRTSTGALDTSAPELGRWRSQVLAGLLSRMRTALDRVQEDGAPIELGLDVRVNWDDPAAGRPDSGQDYEILIAEVPELRLQLWTYIDRPARPAGDIETLTAALRAAGYDMSRLMPSIGLWTAGPQVPLPQTISADRLGEAVRSAVTNGITAVNVTPYSLITPEQWEALAQAWAGG